MSFTIVTDSCCNLPEPLIEQYDLRIIPLMFHAEGKEYLGYSKGNPLDLQQFYAMMRRKVHVMTSSASPQHCQEIFQAALQQGDDLLYIGFSSGLSASYDTAASVLLQLAEAYPSQRVFAVDSLCAALGEGLLVTYAARMREKGADIEEVYSWLLDNRLHLCHWFTVDDLFFLHRGGRVSKAAAIVGSMVGIKPVLHVDNDGHLIMKSKVRGRKASLDALVQKMAELASEPGKQTVYIVHGDCEADAKYVADAVKARFGVKDILIQCLDPVIGSHSGPGTVALFFMGRER
ncbi:DegV family protein [Intestinibacillus massiliensis]|nr:DegV family protein [Intestinibacillus massiliensis]